MEQSKSTKELIIITGMSGAGKSVAIRAFEDLGYYCIDNLPPVLLPTFIKLMKDSNKELTRTVVVMDLRGGDFFASSIDALDEIERENDVATQIVFLDADNETLVRRYKETRRSHPLAYDSSPLEGIRQERELLSEIKGRAKQIYNTSNMAPKELRNVLIEQFSGAHQNTFTINVMSFGFKHGMPIDADLVFDVRFLPNPYYIEELRAKTGLEEDVSSFVLKQKEAQTLIDKLTDLLDFMIPLYKKEGKTQLVIAFGCTGGQHRSVTLAEYFGKTLADLESTVVSHRDIAKRKG
ncbi:RNase adapter RapZ [Kurthia sibirica]|uniref:RNase adapter RapZ n=1 Tax=Kurthia sibirica TaxID=202750 RepID=A0A2U3AJF7_9BACL|nr:RNase adapter RapZ [Kurthia sibirica]PWI24614.1 RNase adapter RapZ [Kurthia sibirica]GEK33441.1 nucleotide-binding protein [Kurthia sibirica]